MEIAAQLREDGVGGDDGVAPASNQCAFAALALIGRSIPLPG